MDPSRSFLTLDDPLADAPPVTQGFDAAGLREVMLAEMAGQRGDYQQAARGYLQATERYGSPQLAERATLAARYANDQPLLERAARHWQGLAPQSELPARLLSSLALQRGDWKQAFEQRLALARRGQEAELTSLAELAIDSHADPTPLLAELRPFAEANPQHADAQLATALLETANGEPGAADHRLARLAESQPDLAELWLVRASIAMQTHQYEKARDAASRGLTQAPDDSRLTLALAQAYLALGQIAEAEIQSERILASHDDSPMLRMALAQMFLDGEAPATARRLLLPLLDRDETPSAAYILLGAIAEQAGEIDNALLYYRQVPPGEGFLDARARAAHMLVEADRELDAHAFLHIERLRHPSQRIDLLRLEMELFDARDRTEAANALLDRALLDDPDDTELRYMRAMRAYGQGDLDTMEQDLRVIIDQEPDNSEALNALGYTLASETDRNEEALALIERAHRLEPESAAILDSLGWVHYQLGNLERALPYLQEAFRKQPDQEIAAHLAEVLWHLGQKDEARAIVADTLARFAEHPAIDALLQQEPRLAPTPTEALTPTQAPETP
ncbi:tetratricopeptide repeat protein [Halomonas shantousis]